MEFRKKFKVFRSDLHLLFGIYTVCLKICAFKF